MSGPCNCCSNSNKIHRTETTRRMQKEQIALFDATGHPIGAKDRAAAYRRGLIRTVNSRHDEAVRVWEQRIVAYVGRSDERTLDLARELDKLKRQGRDPEPLLMRATIRQLPTEHPTAALAYRIRKLLAPQGRRPDPVGIDHRRPAPLRREPGIGI